MDPKSKFCGLICVIEDGVAQKERALGKSKQPLGSRINHYWEIKNVWINTT